MPHANTMQKSRARRGRRRIKRPRMRPMEAYEFRTAEDPYSVKTYWRRRHRVSKSFSWGKQWKIKGGQWS